MSQHHPLLGRTKRFVSVQVLLSIAILVPTLALTLTTVTSYNEAKRQAEVASDLVGVVELTSDLRMLTIALGAELEIEPYQVRLQDLGLDLTQLEAFLGSGETRNPIEVSRGILAVSIEDLTASIDDGSGRVFDRRKVLALMEGVDDIHARVDSSTISEAELRTWFGERLVAVETLADETFADFEPSSETIGLLDRMRSIDALSQMTLFAFDELYRGSGIMIQFPGVDADPENLLNYATARANDDAQGERFLRYASPDDLALWNEHLANPLVQEWLEQREDVPVQVGLVDGTPDPTFDAIRYSALGFDQAVLRAELIGDMAAGIAADAEAIQRAAETNQREALVRAALIALAGIVGIVMVVQTIVRPLRRLRRRAYEVANGRIEGDPLGPIGPTEVAAVALTMDEMVRTLQRVDHQMAAIANDRPTEDDLRTVLPGPLGQTVRHSVNSVNNLTARLRDSEARARAVVGNAADGILAVTISGCILAANEAAEMLFGCEALDLEGAQLAGHFHEHDRRELRALLDGAASGDTTRETLRLVSLGDRGEAREVSLSVSRHDDATEMTVVMTDVSERLRLQRELEHQALSDGLTGVANRTGALVALEGALSSATAERPVSLLFADLDNFKAINDMHGHGVGDEALRQVASMIVDVVGDKGTVGRIGGDEFVLVLSDTTAEAAIEISHAIEREVSTIVADATTAIGVSVGVAIATTPDARTATLLADADLALYAAKTSGATVLICDDGLRDSARRRRHIESKLTEAIGTPSIDLHLQPVVNTATGEVMSAEALARWDDDGTTMSPAEFIAVAEQSGLIVELDRWALRRAAELAVHISNDLGRVIPVAVNISWRHLRDGDLVADLDSVLQATGCAPEMLRIELTESVVPLDTEAIQFALQRVAAMGVGLSLDDFGTGYTSINQLRRFPFDTVKIDRSLVLELRAHDERSLVDVVMQLGEILGLNVVGEGVENERQLELLSAAGCEVGQGWLWSPALPLEAFCTYARASAHAAAATSRA